MSTLIRLSLGLACLILSVSLAFPDAAPAHRVTVFAWVDGDTVHTTSQFSRSNKVHEGLIEIFDVATGERLVSGKTNDQGEYSFTIPAAVRRKGVDLRVALKAGEGHAGEWIVPAAEYMSRPGGDALEPAKLPAKDESAQVPGQTGADPVSAQSTSADTQAIEQLMERVLDRKLAPVTRMLAEQMQAGPSVSDIVGGIGWLVGLAGVGAWFASRKKQ